MPKLSDIVKYCDQRTNRLEIKDFPGALNGLQVENDGTVTKIGASVDAGLGPFQQAAARGIDFLIVHHGLFWSPLQPLTGVNFEKCRTLMRNNCALYSSHLPLDYHREIGNNALICQKLNLEVTGSFLPFEGNDIALQASINGDRDELEKRLSLLFPAGFTAIRKGPEKPKSIAVLSGSGASVVDEMRKVGADTLITGELRQHHFNFAEENKLNLYVCGHYATETFGVSALAAEVAEKFGLEYEFIGTDCPL